MTGELQGKTVLVTGGARGLGRGMVERLAASGALVAFNYASRSDAARECLAAVEAKGGDAFAIQAELGSTDSIERFARALDARLLERTGRSGLDILVNNIGGGAYGTIPNTSPELFDQTFANNVRVPFLLTRALLPQLREGGRVINISSAAARLAGVDFAVYSMSKAALDMFTKILAKELGPRRIPVNAVAPGFNATDANQDVMSDPTVKRQIEEMTALGRFGQPGDIAEVVHALASAAGGWVTGQIIEASGGFRL
jgi:NAD(P)-dependent dehydrogenase (short-subunit alcohol dehydrogenase family)